jgi:hypothetical protein
MLTGTSPKGSNWVEVDDDRPGVDPEFSTRTVRTGGGGLHYYFSTKRRWKNSAKGSIHVRGDGDRHDALGRYIGHLFKEGKGIHEVRKEIRLWNEEHVYPPLSQTELNRYIDDVATKERKPEAPEIESKSFLSMLEFLSTYTPSKQQWLVEGWMPSSSAGIISALPGCYKTWLLLELALSIASGKPFLGGFPIPLARPVVFCQLEDDFTLLADRLRILLGSDLPTFEGETLTTVLHPDLPLKFYDGRRLDISSTRSMEALEQYVGDHKAALLIIDPMNAAVSMEDYGVKSVQALNRFKEMRDRTGVTQVLSHHDQKSAKESTRQTTYGTVFFDAWKEFGWNITKTAPDAVKIKRHAKLVPYLSDVAVRFRLAEGAFDIEEE